MFSRGAEVLEVGKVGANSGPRYAYQHYMRAALLARLHRQYWLIGKGLGVETLNLVNSARG